MCETGVRTKVVCADLEGFVLPHQQPRLLAVRVFQELGLADASFLPLFRFVVIAIELALPACRACPCRLVAWQVQMLASEPALRHGHPSTTGHKCNPNAGANNAVAEQNGSQH